MTIEGAAAPSRETLEATRCWEPSDVARRRPAMTAFRQRTRLHQARWREEHGIPIGYQPHNPRPGSDPRPVGSRIALVHGRETGANLLTPAALAAARGRTAFIER